MRIDSDLTEETLLAELGRRLAARRIELQLTQAQAAEEAGIAKRTLERMEAGHSSQLSNFIRVLRVLDALPQLDGLLPDAGPRPMDYLRRSGKVRKRVSSRSTGDDIGSSAEKAWRWGDDDGDGDGDGDGNSHGDAGANR